MTTVTTEDSIRVQREADRVVIHLERSGATIATCSCTPAAALALVGQLSLAAAAMIAEGVQS